MYTRAGLVPSPPAPTPTQRTAAPASASAATCVPSPASGEAWMGRHVPRCSGGGSAQPRGALWISRRRDNEQPRGGDARADKAVRRESRSRMLTYGAHAPPAAHHQARKGGGQVASASIIQRAQPRPCSMPANVPASCHVTLARVGLGASRAGPAIGDCWSVHARGCVHSAEPPREADDRPAAWTGPVAHWLFGQCWTRRSPPR
eukprot:scaffold1129_cov376-Prasinococcus_capsulatus_cf.AAC.6